MSALRTLLVYALILCLSPLMAVARPLLSSGLLSNGLSCAGQACCRTKKHSCCQKKAPNTISSHCGKSCCGSMTEPLTSQGFATPDVPGAALARFLAEEVARTLAGARLAPLTDPALFQRPPPSLTL
jgi:hypothetical protein